LIVALFAEDGLSTVPLRRGAALRGHPYWIRLSGLWMNLWKLWINDGSAGNSWNR